MCVNTGPPLMLIHITHIYIFNNLVFSVAARQHRSVRCSLIVARMLCLISIFMRSRC